MGASFKTKLVDINVDSASVKLNLWDTAGQEKFKALTRMYFQDAEAAIVVYDMTFKESFDSAKNWVRELRENSNV